MFVEPRLVSLEEEEEDNPDNSPTKCAEVEGDPEGCLEEPAAPVCCRRDDHL